MVAHDQHGRYKRLLHAVEQRLFIPRISISPVVFPDHARQRSNAHGRSFALILANPFTLFLSILWT
jgi:hypothetical protein